jgi:diaminopimelate decarboxylase
MNIDFKELANKYQTPYYVYDFDHITKQYDRIKRVLLEQENL